MEHVCEVLWSLLLLLLHAELQIDEARRAMYVCSIVDGPNVGSCTQAHDSGGYLSSQSSPFARFCCVHRLCSFSLSGIY